MAFHHRQRGVRALAQRRQVGATRRVQRRPAADEARNCDVGFVAVLLEEHPRQRLRACPGVVGQETRCRRRASTASRWIRSGPRRRRAGARAPCHWGSSRGIPACGSRPGRCAFRPSDTARPSCSSSRRTLWQLPEGEKPWTAIMRRVPRRASHSSRVWPQISMATSSNGAGNWPGPRLREPRRLASFCEATLSGSIEWITSVQPRLSKAQSIEAAAASSA